MTLGGNSHIPKASCFQFQWVAPLCIHVNMVLSSIQLFCNLDRFVLSILQAFFKHCLLRTGPTETMEALSR